MMKTRCISVVVMAAIGLPGWAFCQSQSRFPLTAHRVAEMLTESGRQTSDAQVSLLANVTASEPAPLLEILSVEPFAGRTSSQRCDSCSLVKIGCREPGVCLPFYSVVTGLAPSQASRKSAPSPLARAKTQRPDFVIRIGAHATLVMDDARAHVELSVVSLENGAAGHKIRVATPDHKQVYLAEVVSANRLKRSF